MEESVSYERSTMQMSNTGTEAQAPTVRGLRSGQVSVSAEQLLTWFINQSNSEVQATTTVVILTVNQHYYKTSLLLIS